MEGFLERRGDHTEIVAGGREPDLPGFFLEPTVVAGLRQDDEMIQREIFGPVIAALPFEGLDEAVAIANNSRYGLAASVWTRDLSKAFRVMKSLKAGTVWINSHNTVDPNLPFGGMKQSGIGRELGMAGLDEYRETKHIWHNVRPAPQHWFDGVGPAGEAGRD